PTGALASGASGRVESSSTIWATTSATDSGVAGCGVGTRNRSPISFPFFRSTMPPLMPVPPMSIPISGAFLCFFFSSFLLNTVPFVAGAVGRGAATWLRGLAKLGEGQDFGPGVRDQQGVLELRGPLVVAGHHGPIISPHVPFDGAER